MTTRRPRPQSFRQRLLIRAVHHPEWVEHQLVGKFGEGLPDQIDEKLLQHAVAASRVAELQARSSLYAPARWRGSEKARIPKSPRKKVPADLPSVGGGSPPVMQTDITQERIALNESAFREANERIEAAADKMALEGPAPFICE